MKTVGAPAVHLTGTTTPLRFAVIGKPIAHSRSPEIHAAFGRATCRALTYERLLGEPEEFTADVAAFVAAGGRGMNVTLPFKEQAFALATRRTERAQAAGAVNTLSFEPGGMLADNTDGAGLVNDLTGRHGIRLTGMRVVLIGAGGAARGVLQPLLAAGVAELLIANRTIARAQALAALAGEWSRFRQVPIRALALTDLADVVDTHCRATIVIHATAAGLEGSAPDLPVDLLAGAALAYDMGYAAAPTPFMAAALQAGCAHVVDGLGMLIEQAAESFALWHGVRPDTGPVYASMRPQADGAPTN